MKRLLLIAMALTLTAVCRGADQDGPASSVRLSKSDFRMIRDVHYPGRDLFELAIAAGMYKRKGTEYLPGGERGAVSVRGRTWHGSDGVGLVAYDPQMHRYAIYYLQEAAVPGHHLEILYADDDLIFFSYGSHEDMPTVEPALEVYSVKRDRFARIEAVTTRSGKFGRFDMDALAVKKPGNIGPSMGWDHRHYREKDWVPLSDGKLFHPQRVTLRDGVFTLWYHTDWDIEEFVTAIHLAARDLCQELDGIASNRAPEDTARKLADPQH